MTSLALKFRFIHGMIWMAVLGMVVWIALWMVILTVLHCRGVDICLRIGLSGVGATSTAGGICRWD